MCVTMMIYNNQSRTPNIELINDDCMNVLERISSVDNIVVVTDPPFNIGYHYNNYSDNMKETEYYSMLSTFIRLFPSVIIHYPEQLHKLTLASGIAPQRVVSWVYNSNTAKQHRDIAFYRIIPDFRKVLQPYKNLSDKRIKERMARGILGGRCYDWWYVDQVKNVRSKRQGILVKCR